jgi:hypothetical protein
MMARGQGADERFPIDIGKRQHPRRFPMKAARESDDVGSLCIGAGQADRRFDRFGAAAEKLRAR